MKNRATTLIATLFVGYVAEVGRVFIFAKYVVGTGVAQVGTLLGGLSPTEKRSGRNTDLLYRERKIDLERHMLRIGSKEVSGIPRHPRPERGPVSPP